MKRTSLLHAELSGVIAAMGHGDLLVIGDAGLPIPDGPRRIDLAVCPGVPAFREVLAAVLSELQVEQAIVATEACPDAPATRPDWCAGLPAGAVRAVPHAELKAMCSRARAVVRTGEFTPYMNIVLVSGVVF